MFPCLSHAGGDNLEHAPPHCVRSSIRLLWYDQCVATTSQEGPKDSRRRHTGGLRESRSHRRKHSKLGGTLVRASAGEALV